MVNSDELNWMVGGTGPFSYNRTFSKVIFLGLGLIRLRLHSGPRVTALGSRPRTFRHLVGIEGGSPQSVDAN